LEQPDRAERAVRKHRDGARLESAGVAGGSGSGVNASAVRTIGEYHAVIGSSDHLKKKKRETKDVNINRTPITLRACKCT